MFTVQPGDEKVAHDHQRCIHGMPRYEGCWSCSNPARTVTHSVRRNATKPARPAAPTCSRCFSQHAGEC